MEIIIKMESDERLTNSKSRTSTDERLMVSQYAKFFDETCVPWTKDAEYNLMFLRHTEQHATDRLKCKGHLFLNEVYDMLGMPRTKAGAVIGWVYKEKNPVGDNYVDFGLYDERNSSFINGYEKSILLDFNVDGCILELI